MLRPLLLRSALAGALLWTAYAGLAGMEEALDGFDLADRQSPSAIQWRFGIPQVIRLERFAAAARPVVPPLSAAEPIAFSSPAEPKGDRFYRYRWAAYLLPGTDLVPWEDPAGRGARFLLAFSDTPTPEDVPRLRLLRPLPGGALYAVGPP